MPVKLPLMSVVTSVNGRVSPFTTLLPGTWLPFGLKLMVGKFCANTGGDPGVMSNELELFLL